MIKIQSANNLSASQGVKCVCYGRSGMGKTSLVATAPNPILISAESGLLSLRKENIERMFGVGTAGITYEIPVITVTTVQDLIEVEAWARTSNEAKQFQTLCPDSITEIGEVVLANAKGSVKDPRQAYGELIDKMTMVIKSFRDLPGKHVYMTAKEERVKDEGSGITLAGPAMPGSKLGQQIPYLFDEVFYLGKAKDPATQTDYRFIRTQPDFNFDAKDRSGALAELEHPNLGYIFNKIMGSAAL